MSEQQRLLTVENLRVTFDIMPRNAWPWTRPQPLKAVNNVSFTLNEGETLGIVGESGCGKSTLARAIMGMVPSQAGKVVWLGEDLRGLNLKQLRKRRQRLQMVFQDPLASLSPRMTVGDIIAEPLRTHYPDIKGAELREKVDAIMDRVGLHPHQKNRYPHEFSGGQCQRVGIARALILEPKLIICDEPVSALDVSVQAQVINLLKNLQRDMGLSLIFIDGGQMMEFAATRDLFRDPSHPYTKGLMGAIPRIDEQMDELVTIPGNPPNLMNLPPGCPFCDRCPVAEPRCYHELDPPERFGAERIRVCNLPREAIR